MWNDFTLSVEPQLLLLLILPRAMVKEHSWEYLQFLFAGLIWH